MKITKITFIAKLLSLGIASAAHAGDIGTITISGTVPTSTSIEVSAVAGSNSLNLTERVVDLLVANVTEQSNSTAGYRVTLASANGGALKNGAQGTFAYSAKYDDNNVNLRTEGQQVSNTGHTTSVVNVTKALTISYTGQPSASLMAGTYSDTLTFTIAAN